jgi:hypothetical protein
METQQKLNHSSPVVQRVLRLRERIAQQNTDTERDGTSYQWQMWQKSDFSAYVGAGSEHRCKEMNPSQSIKREVDAGKMQDEPVFC